MREDVPDSIIGFFAWRNEEEETTEFDKVFQVNKEAFDWWQYRAVVKKAYIALNDFIDQLNDDMLKAGELELLNPLEADMMQERISRRHN